MKYKKTCLTLLTLSICVGWGNGANLLNSYLPACMQVLAYYLDHLQYEPFSMTTVRDGATNNNDSYLPTTTMSLTSTSSSGLWSVSNWGNQVTSSTTKMPSLQDIYIKFNNSYSSDTTKSPISTTTTFGVWAIPQWWTHATTPKEPSSSIPTRFHKPALFAPFKKWYKMKFDNVESNWERFNTLPLSLIRDIETDAKSEHPANILESIDNFLRLYDDNYGRVIVSSHTSTDPWSALSNAGKKREPPARPYMEFLLVYDVLKRDAKTLNLSKYEGYSEDLLNELQKVSNISSARQLHVLFKRLLERGDVKRIDTITRVEALINELNNPNSDTAKALRFIPAMPFLA
ncbi:uncharacterized protein LOC119641463 [Glossina fuscipes]|uniref:Uncharacterized protein LOC119641463 n=1 Tax=Glossina fuscipes TaxID=7396 RepID=A0A9C5ZHM7_9MUSC|nr:uncharacterized protein LOC119641463 [Glossina fuscipes]